MSNITIELAEKVQLDSQNTLLGNYNNQLENLTQRITPKDLTTVNAAVLDFLYDDVTITSGGLDSVQRRITT